MDNSYIDGKASTLSSNHSTGGGLIILLSNSNIGLPSSAHHLNCDLSGIIICCKEGQMFWVLLRALYSVSDGASFR